MDVLEFKKAWALYYDNVPDLVVDIYINGERLLDKILTVEKKEVGDDFDHHGLLLPEQIMLLGVWKEHHLNYIFGCGSCGEPGCDPVYVDIRECDDCIIWENIRFYVYTNDRKKEIILPDQYIFSSKDYFSKVRSLRHWLFDVYHYYRGKKIEDTH